MVRVVLLFTWSLLTLSCGGAPVSHTPRPRTGPGHAAPAGKSAAAGRCADLLPLIRKAAEQAGVESALLVGVVRTESDFRNDVRSHAGAIGLTQVMPATAAGKKCGDLSDAYENLLCGSRVLAAFLTYYKGNLLLGLSGYNAGHAMPTQAGRNRALPANVTYVEDVLWARSVFLSRGCDF
jgi:soluble lytic murein transglycosylase-like protein